MTQPTSESVHVPNSIFPSGPKGGVPSKVYLLAPGPQRFIANWNQYGTTVHLGKLPPGEIILALRTCDNYTLCAGDSKKNPDHLVHAVVRSYLSGTIQVWFEDAPGPKGTGRSDRNFTDAVLELRGDASDSSSVVDLLTVIKNEHGATREAAIEALTKISPIAAANAGY
ncbi:MAG TPA: hypothetical protein VFC44_13180 [Candidatus Saccharimonadales bacterium]|nr:hypothetical protein [Candidatus Saccharimonadales bacterium]